VNSFALKYNGNVDGTILDGEDDLKRILPIVAVLALAAVGVGFYFPFGRSRSMTLPGIVEIQEVRLGSKVGGRIAKVEVKEGDHVNPRQPLVIFEVPELENQKEQWKARLDAAEAEYLRAKNGARREEKAGARAAAEAAKAKYDRLVEGWREEEKRWAASELESAAAELKQTADEWERSVELYRSKSIAKAEYDSARGNHDRAKGRFNAAKSKVDMYSVGNRKEDIAEAKANWEQALAKSQELENGNRPEDIALALAKRDEAAAKLREIEINLSEAVVRVPDASEFEQALVEVVPIRAGDIVAANQPVIRLLCVRDLWVKTFVPETKMNLVTVGQRVKVHIDSDDGKIFDGEVYHKAAASEFTPRNVQSVDERRYQVFALKVRVADPKGVLNSGMAAQVTFPLETEK
jgi:HlyD family secretion protein